MVANNGVLMSNVMNHHMGRDDEVDCSHDGRKSGPMRRLTWRDHS